MSADTLRPARVAVQQAGGGLTVGAWLVDLSERAIFVASGRHRARFLHNFTTCQIKELPVGQGVWGAVTNGQGGIVAQALVDAEEDTIGVEVARELRAEVIAHLLKFRIADQVTFEERDDLAAVTVTGAGAREVVEGAGLPWVDAELAFVDTPWRDTGVRVQRNDYRWDATGVDVTITVEHLDVLRTALLDAGALSASSERVAQHRVAHGIPVDRIDVHTDTTPLEAAYLRPTVNWNKGCYLGQEVICMMEDLGKPRRQLIEVHAEGSALESGSALHNDKGKKVGSVSTATDLDGGSYGLALVKRKSAKAGVILTLDDGRVATVIGLAGAGRE